MKLGISSYSLTWSIGIPGYELPNKPVNALELLRIAWENRVELVQIADNIPLHEMEMNELELIAKTAKAYGIALEVGTRGTSPEHLLEYLLIARLFDSKIVRTLITFPDIAEACKDIEEVLPQFAKEGISIAIENHGQHTTRQLVELFDTLNSPFVGCCLDTVNSFGAIECPEQVIHNLIPYTINLHIKDFEIKRHRHQLGYEIIGTPAGSGRLDLDQLFTLLRKYQKQPNVILEIWTPFTDSVDKTVQIENQWFNQSLDYLKNKICNDVA